MNINLIGNAFMVLILLLMLISCRFDSDELGSVTSSEENVFSVADVATIMTTVNENNNELLLENTEKGQVITSSKKYKYQPPKEVMNTQFYSKDIEKEIVFDEYTPEFYAYMNFYDKGYRELLLEDFYKHYPKEIVDDLNVSIISKIENSYADSYNEKEKIDCKIIRIGCMMYDMNFDGTEDYVIDAWVSENGDDYYFGFDLCKIYLVVENSAYKSIDWENNKLSPHKYILSSQTNGLKNLLILTNGNKPESTYDGKSRYIDSEYLDEKHLCEVKLEQVENNIVKCFGMLESKGISGKCYYAAYFQDNPYLKNNILYSCAPDGTPKIIDSQEFEFYAELKEGVIIPEYCFLTPTEFRYIPVD